ncbi:uncharacterized protein EV420DRAFT_1732682 [Desarmillaria tabescens]|uniref:XPG-I domain-containing protein n=1 Tax=Armillaria tabescens TaxID=1929756 RepID=A0AA39NCK7_ARMTA|nr:uncharacterized protein EV420DRAFT_1732682 [Desarmillaria tabescens]KAK0463130.1 hypothetical protein EV420DRAFT_1732682 [Desarmillaria tabescens]
MTPMADNDNGNDWSLLAHIQEYKSLTALSLSKFDSPPWFHHSDSSKEGENLQLRLLFFRCKHLLEYPILPLFMFDKNPKRHRDNHPQMEKLMEGFIDIIEAFEFEWRDAPGDPLAELVHLNEQGIIDAVMTDNVAIWVFGTKTVWRNPSSSHLKAKPLEKQNLCKFYDGTVMDKHCSMMLMILLCHHGHWCDAGTLLRLAKTDLTEEIYREVTAHLSKDLKKFLPEWHTRLGPHLKDTSYHVLKDFPDLSLLTTLIHPCISAQPAETYPPRIWMDKEPSLPKLARICKKYFEWGWKDRILVRFHSTIWGSIALRILRQKYLCPSLLDNEIFRHFGGDSEAGRVVDRIVGERSHDLNDGTCEYRVVVDMRMLIAWTEAGLEGMREGKGRDGEEEVDGGEEVSKQEKGGKKKRIHPQQPLRIWIPEIMVQHADVGLVKEYEKDSSPRKVRMEKSEGRPLLSFAKTRKESSQSKGGPSQAEGESTRSTPSRKSLLQGMKKK